MAGEKNSALDLDLQAVENIPRDTLVALLRRKDKELKTQQGKIEKLEERYVKVVRFNKILMEDRQSFQRFCHELLPECDGAFEEAALQETPTDLQELLRQLGEWRSHSDAARDDRKVFQQFLELCFPGDESLAKLFARPNLGEGAFDLLQKKWMELEDLHNQSIASINAMAREQAVLQQEDLQQAQQAQREAEKKLQEMKEELTGMAREKAQMLKQKLHGRNAGSTNEVMEEATSPSGREQRELRALEEQKAAAERREKEVWQSLERQREAMQATIDELRAEVRRLRLDLERERCEAELHREEADRRLEEKEMLMSQLRLKTGELEQELTSTDSITRLAEQQANREVEMKKHQQQVQQVNQSLLEVQKMLQMSYAQEKVLKERIRELESSQGRTHMAGDYLKHVVLKYIEYCQKGDMKSQSLVPVLCTLLNLNSTERKLVEHSSIPAPLQHLNQAAGAAGAWFRGPPSIFVPAVHLNDGVGQLVALTYKSIMLVLILDEDVHVDARLLESLRDSCTAASGDGLSLAELQPLIVPQYKEIMEQEDEYRFVYYNHTNHALRLSNQASMSRSLLRTTGVTSLGPKAAEKPLLTPLHATLADPKLKCREVSWKSADRGWICAKRWCDREFYLLLDGTSTSLSRCQEECARFASIHFSNIVMM